jgi:hypothetical protein
MSCMSLSQVWTPKILALTKQSKRLDALVFIFDQLMKEDWLDQADVYLLPQQYRHVTTWL